jgi:hypothetical protein
MVKQTGLFSPKFGATSPHVFTRSPQNLALNPEFTVRPVGTGASRYHNCYIDGGAMSEYFGQLVENQRIKNGAFYFIFSSSSGFTVFFKQLRNLFSETSLATNISNMAASNINVTAT